MKVIVKSILPNPYRNIKHYPFDKAKVDSLKKSIQEKTFWDNILIRQKDGKLELAYGHHRLEALKQLGVKEINVPVRTEKELSDALMVQIMAEENHDWSQSPAMMNQTVDGVKKFLDEELGKCDAWDSGNRFISSLGIGNQAALGAAKKGVGQTTILKFLGKNWKQWEIQEALDSLGYGVKAKVDRKAVETIPNMSQAREFKKVVREHGISVPAQRKLAQKIVKDPKIHTRQVRETAEEYVPALLLNKPKPKPSKPLPMLDDFVKEACKEMSKLNLNLAAIGKEVNSIQSKFTRENLFLRVKDLQTTLTEILEKE